MIAEPYRPRLHFSPASGWLNDPNGLILVDGTWHLFYQHHPSSTQWGPMHWGHASSPDLVNWTQLPVALSPNSLGTCFSGSAIATPTGDIKLFYTAHQRSERGSDLQVQCVVNAGPDLTRFENDRRNPIVGNPGLEAFRDPKVLFHAQSDRWIMLLTHGQAIGIRSSDDLVNWRLESEFGEGHGRHGSGPWECPDLLELEADDGTTHWVLIVGVASDTDAGGSGTQYFVGQFDGHRFINENPPQTVLWMDHGRDYYAAQSFFGADQPTAVAWASNWQYAQHTPTTAFRGSMTLPRRLSLAATNRGYRVRATLPPQVASAFTETDPSGLPTTGTYRVCVYPDLDHWPSQGIALFGEKEPQFVVSRHAGGKTSLRCRRPPLAGAPSFAHDYEVELPDDGPPTFDIYIDNGLVEISAGGGLVWLTFLYFPKDPAGRVRRLGESELGSAGDTMSVTA